MTNLSDPSIAVLLVDDGSPAPQPLGERLQADSRFRLVWARTADELDRLLIQERFDLVVSELRPWERTELWTLERARSHHVETPVVFVTARGSEHAAVEALKRGAADYIPLAGSCLEKIAEQLLSAARQAGGSAETSRLHEQLFEQSIKLISVIGFDGHIKRWNPAWNVVLGYSQDEAMGASVRDLVHPDDRGRAAKVRQQLMEGKNALAVELRVRGKDGTYKWMLFNATPCPAQNVYLATVQDITTRKEYEQQLRESQERFELVANATKDAIWDWDLRENRLWRNEAYEQTFGSPDDAGEGTIEWWISRIHPDDRARVWASMPPPVIDSRQQWTMEYRLRRLDGEYARVYDRGFVLCTPEGEPVRMVGSLMDISALKDAEEKLRESEERFRLAARATRDAIWDWDLRDGEVWRSEGFQTLFGYGPDEIGKSFDWWIERIHEDDRERVLAELPPASHDDMRQSSIEYRFRRADGSYADVHDRGFVLFNAHNKPVRMIGTMTDISERRRAEEMAHMQLAELARIARVSTMGEIATGLAHELNQPLTAIANYAESCAQAIGARGGGDPKLLNWIEKIMSNTHRAGQILRRLRGFTRRSESHRATVEVNSLIQEVIDLLEADQRMHKVRVRWAPHQPLYTEVDTVQIQQVLVNLLVNAFEAMSSNGFKRRQVTIAAVPNDETVEITVEDRGEGIDPDSRDRVFDAFFTTKPNGAGIGLAISRSIVEDHGGRLWVTPNRTQGVTFHFTLPLTGVPDVSLAHSLRR